MTPLAQALNTALLHFVWQGIALGLLLWIALFLLRRRSANARYLASCGALALLVMAPVVTAWQAYMPTAGQVSWKAGEHAVTGADIRVTFDSTSEVFSGLQAWIVPAWAFGVALFAVRLIWCWGHTAALRRTGTAAESSFLVMVSRAAGQIGVTRRIRVLMSSIAEVPSVVGWVRPVLLLPVSVATGLTPEQLEALIAHELAHVRRHDYLVNLGQTVVETVLFYHPAVWWVSSRIRHEREFCCDDLAVAAVGDAGRYARALARLEEVRVVQPSLAMGAKRGPLFHRIERLLGGDGLQQGPSRLACAIGLLIGVSFLALNLGWAKGRQAVPGATSPAIIQDFFAPLPPMPPVPPMPPMPPIPAMPATPPLPPLPPMPPMPELPATLSAALQGIGQGADIPWVLFRGDRVVARGSAADQTEAHAARQSAGGGDLLWFRLDGKTYTSTDKGTLDRIAERQVPGGLDLARALEGARETVEQARGQAELRADIEALRAQMPAANASLEQLHSARAELERLRGSLAEVMARVERDVLTRLQQSSNAQREVERKYREAERLFMPQLQDLLREAVNSGNARPAP
jgi:beta-lactamase regulating signal transducer with metallopeptidase domain